MDAGTDISSASFAQGQHQPRPTIPPQAPPAPPRTQVPGPRPPRPPNRAGTPRIKEVVTTMICTHVLNKGGPGIRSPVDAL